MYKFDLHEGGKKVMLLRRVRILLLAGLLSVQVLGLFALSSVRSGLRVRVRVGVLAVVATCGLDGEAGRLVSRVAKEDNKVRVLFGKVGRQSEAF